MTSIAKPNKLRVNWINILRDFFLIGGFGVAIIARRHT